MIHDAEYSKDLREGYGRSNEGQWCGFMTYRYMSFYCKNVPGSNFRTIRSLNDLMGYDTHHNFIHYFVHTERLALDLIQALESAGVALTPEHKAAVISFPIVHQSSRNQKAKYYYCRDTRDLVHERDQS